MYVISRKFIYSLINGKIIYVSNKSIFMFNFLSIDILFVYILLILYDHCNLIMLQAIKDQKWNKFKKPEQP